MAEIVPLRNQLILWKKFMIFLILHPDMYELHF